MRHIKHFRLFLEENEFEIKDTDDKDIKMSKQKLNDLKKYLTEYPQKKVLLDKAFSSKDPKLVESEVEKILGKDSEKRNPFLVEYTTVSRLKKEVETTQKENTDDKIRLDDFRQESSLSKESEVKKSVDAKISDINNRISIRNKKIVDYIKEIQNKEKELLEKMKKMTTDIETHINKISSLKKK